MERALLSIILMLGVMGCGGRQATDRDHLTSLAKEFFYQISYEAVTGEFTQPSWADFLDRWCRRVDSRALLEPSLSDVLVLNPSLTEWSMPPSRERQDATALFIKWNSSLQGPSYLRLGFDGLVTDVDRQAFRERVEQWEAKASILITDIATVKERLRELASRRQRSDPSQRR